MLDTSPIDSQPLTVFRNADFQKTITVKKDGVAVDLTGYTVECKIRDSSGSSFVPGNVITATGALLVAASGTLTISLTVKTLKFLRFPVSLPENFPAA